MSKSYRNEAKAYVQSLQNKIVAALEDLNGETFKQDAWSRPGGGGGDTRVFESGRLLEKGGVNFSEVFGELTPEHAASMPLGSGTSFYATGISLVLHPLNPF